MEKRAKTPKRYLWTRHVQWKMRYYRLSESRIRRVLRHPDRTEQSIVEGAVAFMQRAGTSTRPSEIWVMGIPSPQGKLILVSAWRYPGKSPERDPVPEDILQEVQELLRQRVV